MFPVAQLCSVHIAHHVRMWRHALAVGGGRLLCQLHWKQRDEGGGFEDQEAPGLGPD